MITSPPFPRAAVHGTRNIGPANMILNDRLGQVRVNALSGRVTLDGDLIESKPADCVSLSRLYFL